MSLNKALILPHSPLLIPEIGRTNHAFLEKTSQIYQQLNTELKELGFETIIIISPHGLESAKSFCLNVAPEMTINLQDFGFIPPKNTLLGDFLLADKIKNTLRNNFSLELASENILDYGSAIPLYLLKNPKYTFKILVISPAQDLDLETHYAFGQALQNIIKESPQKIAIISSSDLSHRLKKKSPGGYSPKGAKFDNKLIEYLSEPETAGENIIKLDPNLINEAGECGLKPIIILLGITQGLIADSKILAYQTDFGIGYLSLDLKLENSYDQ
jgi:aromatic ring-opening dioxygenase LigB subunit